MLDRNFAADSLLGALAFMKNIEISSPQTDRKVAWWASVVFMILAWLALAFFLVWVFIAGRPETWGFLEYMAIAVAILAFVFIPFQVIRYFGEKRARDI